MRSALMAAVWMQLTAAGNGREKQVAEPDKVAKAAAEVKANYSALKKELDTLSQEWREAREKARAEAERRKREAEGDYEPATAQREATSGSGAGTSGSR